ncbi:hypothetical protein BKA93DRAFT_139265 [Sparassis latifolia]
MALKQILGHLGALSSLLDRYEPPSPHAVFSPNTSDLRGRIHQQLTAVCQKASGARLYDEGVRGRQRPADASELEEVPVQNDDADRHADRESTAVQHHKVDKNDPQIVKRGDSVLAAFGKAVLRPEELISVALGMLGRSNHASTEDAALRRLLRGYAYVCDEKWDSLLLAHSFTMPPGYASTIAASDAHDNVGDVHLRLELRHTAIAQKTNETHANSCIYHILSQIETIKFARDWQARSFQAGGKAWVSKFYASVFQDDPKYKPGFDGLTWEARETRLEALDAEFKKWKRDNEHIVTARNRLLKLYNTFGAAVLVDPTWSVDDLSKRRSRDFPSVMQYIYAHIPITPRLEPGDDEDGDGKEGRSVSALTALQTNTNRAVIRIVGAFGGPDVAQHVSKFLEAHPPTFELM